MEGSQMSAQTPAPNCKTVKVRCPQCNNITPARYNPNGTTTGVCNHCKATFVRRTKNKETTIKIYAV